MNLGKNSIFTNISYYDNKDFDHKYDFRKGLVLRLDSMSGIPSNVTSELKLTLKLIHRYSSKIYWEKISRSYIRPEYQNDVLLIDGRFQIFDIMADPDIYLYIEMEAQLGFLIYSGLCWTMIKLFDDKEELLFGRKKVRFF